MSTYWKDKIEGMMAKLPQPSKYKFLYSVLKQVEKNQLLYPSIEQSELVLKIERQQHRDTLSDVERQALESVGKL